MAYDKIKSICLDTSLVGDMAKLSSVAQTSCLEGYHATLNYWYPKMIHFPWMGTFCRYVLLLCSSIYIRIFKDVNYLLNVFIFNILELFWLYLILTRI